MHDETLTEVTIPCSVTQIGYNAFRWASNLKSVHFSGNMLEIGDNAFPAITGYYPAKNKTWDLSKLSSSGIKEWVALCPDHVLGEWVIEYEPTCVEEGLWVKRCPNCDEKETESVPALGHKWDEGKVTRDPNEEAEGEMTFTCTACKDTKTEPIPKLDHTHKYTDKVTPSTCTKKGYTTHTCACGDSYTDSETAAKGHTEVVDKAVAATCSTTGLTEGKHCSVCNAVTVKQEPVPVKEHTWDSGKVTKEATETAEGENLFTCIACEQTKTEIIPTKEHVHKYTEKATAPTCTEKGYTTHTCSCGDTYTDSEIAAKGHSWDDGKVTKEPTETIEGEKTFNCTNCKETKVESIEKLPPSACEHDSTKVENAKEATCMSVGYTGDKVCSSCGETVKKGIEISTTSHVVVADPAVDATCIQTGLTAGEHCSICSTVVIAQNVVPQKDHSFVRGKCVVCDLSDPGYGESTEPKPSEPKVERIAGDNRFTTAFAVANQMKANLGIEKVNAVIVASGTNFADALSGSYLAAVKNAPILLSFNDKYNDLAKDYIRANLNPGGTVYILGGTAAVPASMEIGLDGFKTVRLAGDDRFGTNLAILKEAGVSDKDILVCTGLSFADSLSASASERPILLVWKNLTDSQKEFLGSMNGNKLYVIGGESAVSEDMKNQVAAYGAVERIGGANRFETSANIARKFFEDPNAAIIAYAWNYPDGLCGGALAATMDAPLILTMEKYEAQAAEYIQANAISGATILGGEKLIPTSSVNTILGK